MEEYEELKGLLAAVHPTVAVRHTSDYKRLGRPRNTDYDIWSDGTRTRPWRGETAERVRQLRKKYHELRRMTQERGAARCQALLRGHLARKQTIRAKHAALKVQAIFRGRRLRAALPLTPKQHHMQCVAVKNPRGIVWADETGGDLEDVIYVIETHYPFPDAAKVARKKARRKVRKARKKARKARKKAARIAREQVLKAQGGTQRPHGK